jgi:hypothetical protein
MNMSLLVLSLWLSSTVASEGPIRIPPVDPTVDKALLPSPDKWVPKEAPKLPAKTTAAKLLWKPGSYSAESLKLPQRLPIEQFDQWNQGPGWPQIDGGVVVVIDDSGDPHRFLAYLVDVKAQKVAAIRDGDKTKHLMMIGQTQVPQPSDKNPGGVQVWSIMQLAGSGAVIILRPPPPPGPGGVPDDLIPKILDAATIASQAGASMSGLP